MSYTIPTKVNVRKYRKAIVAAIAAIVTVSGLVSAAVADDEVSIEEAVTIVSAILAPFGVFLLPNERDEDGVA